MKRFALFLFTLTAPLMFAQSADSMESVFNSFIATFAKEQVEWRKDLALTTTPNAVEPGRQLGYSKALGYFTFTPKAWEDFTVQERSSIVRHPKFRAFIISLRNSNLYPSVGVAEKLVSGQREAPNLNKSRPAYPIDGVPVTLDPVEQTPAQPREIVKLQITPEQMISKRSLRVELY